MAIRHYANKLFHDCEADVSFAALEETSYSHTDLVRWTLLAQEDWWKHLLEIAFHIHPEDATQYDKEMIVDICKEYGKNIVIKTCLLLLLLLKPRGVRQIETT